MDKRDPLNMGLFTANSEEPITNAAIVTGAWREGHLDDLVLALALALWYGMEATGQAVLQYYLGRAAVGVR